MLDDYSKIIKDNLLSLNSEIEKCCAINHRDKNEVHLIAVSKGQKFDKIIAAYNLGVRHFGESYAQELAIKQKHASEASLNDIKWHFIGAIQTNKIKTVASADFVHSVGSIKHAEALSKAACREIQVFLQVNLGDSLVRPGFTEDALHHAWEIIEKLDNLKLIGLMTILPLSPAMPQQYWFSKMDQIKQHIKKPLLLSMGMSGDFVEAIAAGANFIRIGEKLFGKRGDAVV